ncbi:DUF3526 domain-containing protein [Luteimonas saliphila]|uniref:DUF3526 domain-containing protein n=1 Tax=Luteimonas saliphila TaxID=2804919 RepID=UPI00192E06D1|nr:DUF3526 domain-containing protein [Luteimonas saliphila]
MTRLLAQEWRLFSANRANLLVLGVLGLLLGFTVVNGVVRVTETRAAQREAIAATTDSWLQARARYVELEQGTRERQTFDDPSRADLVVMHARITIAMPPTPLASLSVGPAREGNDLITFGVGSRHSASPPSRENPAIRLDGPLDAAFVVAWLLPLVLIVLAYDSLSRDREQQITPVLASQGTSLGTIMFARLAVCFLAVLGVVGTIATAGVLASWEGPFLQLLPDLLSWLLALAAAIAFWLALAGLINAHARNSATAGVTLLATWILSAVLLPVVSSQVLSQDGPAPQRLDSVIGRRALDSDLTERATEVTEAYYAENPLRRPRRGAFNEYERYFVESYYSRQIIIDRMFTPAARRIEERRVEQAQRLRIAAMFSPALAMKVLTDDFAGYAPERRQRFEGAADRFQTEWRNFFDVKFAARIPLTLWDYDAAPRFAYEDEPPRDRVSRAAWPLLGTVLATLLAAFAAYVRLRRARP